MPDWSLTDWLAIYAAGVSSVLAIARGIAWRRTRMTRIDVYVSTGTLSQPFSAREGVFIEVRNLSDYKVRITNVGLKSRTGPAPIAAETGDLPGVIEPRDSGYAWVGRPLVEDALDLGEPVVGWVETSLGKRHESEATPIEWREEPPSQS